VSYPQQECQSKLVKEKDECDCENWSLSWGSGQTCEGDGLYRGKGMEAHDTGDCSWHLFNNPGGCDKEYCLGVTCNDKQVEDFQACAECSEGYEFAAPSTSHTYLEIKIGELCDNTGKCPSGYRKGNIHTTSAGICNDKLMNGHNNQHTYDCEKQTTRTIAPFTNECRLKPVFCSAGQYLVDRTCRTCPSGQYQYEKEHEKNACISQRECKAGQFMLGGSPTKNGNCKGCPAGQYQQQAAHRDIACIKQPTCSADTYLSGGGSKTEPGTCEDQPSCSVGQYYSGGGNTQQGKCAACQAGKYQDASGHREPSCASQTKCNAGQLLAVNNSDVKASKGTCKECPEGTHQTANNHLQIECKDQIVCGAGKALVASPKEKGVCKECGASTYMNHTAHRHSECFSQPKCDGSRDLILIDESLTQMGTCGCKPPAFAADSGECIFPTTTAASKVVGDGNTGGDNGNADAGDTAGGGGNGGDTGPGDAGPGDAGPGDGSIGTTTDDGAAVAAASTDGDEDTAVPEEEKSTPTVVVVVVGVLLVVILTVLLLLFKQRNKHAIPTGEEVARQFGNSGAIVAGESNPMYDAMSADAAAQRLGAPPPLPVDDDDSYGEGDYGDPDADNYGDGYLGVGPGSTATTSTMATTYDNSEASNDSATIYSIPLEADANTQSGAIARTPSVSGTIVAQVQGGNYEVVGGTSEGLYSPRARTDSVCGGFDDENDSEL